MKTFVLLTLVSVISAFPSGGSDAQPNQWWVHGSDSDGSDSGPKKPSLKDHIHAHSDMIKQYILHAFKASIPQQAADSICSLTPEDRQCISNTKKALLMLWSAGSPNAGNDEASWIAEIKNSCAKDDNNVSKILDDWQAATADYKAQAKKNWDDKFALLPATVQDIITTANTSFNNLRVNHQFVPFNKTAVSEAALEIVNKYLAVPQADWDNVVEQYPNTSVILSEDGELHGNWTVLINAAKELLETGTISDPDAVHDAKNAFRLYGMQQFANNKASFDAMTQSFKDAPESNICPEVLQEIEDNLDASIPKPPSNSPTSN